MKAIELAVLKLLEYRIKYDNLSCSSCFASDVLNTYNNREEPCRDKEGTPLFDADYCESGEHVKCVNCQKAWIKTFEILEEQNIDIKDTEKFNC